MKNGQKQRFPFSSFPVILGVVRLYLRSSAFIRGSKAFPLFPLSLPLFAFIRVHPRSSAVPKPFLFCPSFLSQPYRPHQSARSSPH
jgi:hypothetical protein